MISARLIIMIGVGIAALFLGVFFAIPLYHKDFARVEVKNISVLAEVADTPDARAQGLSGRPSLPEFGGMLFVLEPSDDAGIWMKDMQFAIDALWIRNGVVVDIEENISPSPAETADESLTVYHPDVSAEFILEARAGFARTHDIRIGDDVRILLRGRVFARVERTEEGGRHLVAENESSGVVVGQEYAIEALRKYPLRGRDFVVGDRLSVNDAYEKFSIRFYSGDFMISGVMNVPLGKRPSEGFPVLILNHGLIAPEMYTSGRGSKREQDFFARHRYITIHPDYRGLASSSPYESGHHDFYVGYTQDVVGLVDAVKESGLTYIDAQRIGMWGHSMGGGVAARLMVLRPDIRAFVLFAPISADVEDNFYELAEQEVAWLGRTYGPKGAEIFRAISPITYFADVAAPVQLHHGTADDQVPLRFSESIYRTLQQHQ